MTLKMLDVGCGMGGMSDGFAKEGFDVTGIMYTYERYRHHQMSGEEVSRITKQLLDNIAKTKPEYKAMHPRKAVKRVWQNPFYINAKSWEGFWIYFELVSLFKNNVIDTEKFISSEKNQVEA